MGERDGSVVVEELARSSGHRLTVGAMVEGPARSADTLAPVDASDPDLTSAFGDMVSGPESEIELERAALLIAAHARPGLDVPAELGRLDALAEGCADHDLDALRTHLFGRLGFNGNTDDYYDPANSYLDRVVETRCGIPITLSVLTIAVGHRLGVELVGVALPGHFLVGSTTDADLFLDPFGGGRVLGAEEVEDMFRSLHGAEAAFSPVMLAPVGARAVLTRMLNNLLGIFAARRDARSRLWASQLRAAVPGASIEDRAEVAAALVAVGEYAAAGRWLEALSHDAPPAVGESYRRSAERLRASLN
jgi:regulator of sirC expression with transglutaminase-like and TPR domain